MSSAINIKKGFIATIALQSLYTQTSAEGGTRTLTRLPSHAPETCASTNSTTSAILQRTGLLRCELRRYTYCNVNRIQQTTVSFKDTKLYHLNTNRICVE
jgi:hypothetical protein